MATKSASEVWLIDVSGSMIGPRYEKMKREMVKLHQQCPHAKCLAFSTDVVEVESPEKLPEANGGTNLAEALRRAGEFFPGKVVVFSDGEPQDEDAAFAEADQLPGTVSTLYYGESSNRAAIAFMEKLARNNGGQWITKDLLKSASLLGSDVRELLGLPAPIAL